MYGLYVGIFCSERGQVLLQHCLGVAFALHCDAPIPGAKRAPWRKAYVDFVNEYTQGREEAVSVRPPDAEQLQAKFCDLFRCRRRRRDRRTRGDDDGGSQQGERIECMDVIRATMVSFLNGDDPVHARQDKHVVRDLKDVNELVAFRDEEETHRSASPIPTLGPDDSASNVVPRTKNNERRSDPTEREEGRERTHPPPSCLSVSLCDRESHGQKTQIARSPPHGSDASDTRSVASSSMRSEHLASVLRRL